MLEETAVMTTQIQRTRARRTGRRRRGGSGPRRASTVHLNVIDFDDASASADGENASDEQDQFAALQRRWKIGEVEPTGMRLI